ncbi:MAG: dihydrolipoyl dehydrogenase [Deltaproteobacteria bacterium CG2_30_63_29]|nr:MAG: dihydrolipoyl dehydrogenase [Deltaproteobacteria bacterium CG2_30_63_29]PJB33225.1 MAG: dihydrolipoyl dehydrogenase [Deltaproteobacteria bacterium CG_4_9_14_3_um_filter_63_12]
MSDITYDLVVIGSGPGGYIAAIRAAQLGMSVACVEKDSSLGGTCLNVGCIPSKALLESSELYSAAQKEFKRHGLLVGDLKLDLATMLKRKDSIVSQLTKGVAGLFKKNGVVRVEGWGRIVSATEVEVRSAANGALTSLSTKRVLIATGSSVSPLRGVELDGQRIVTSTEALCFETVPEHLIVIGAGVIGLELGSVWARLGAKVTLLEYLPHILGNTDAETSALALKSLGRQGMQFMLGVKVLSATVLDDKVVVTYEGTSGVAETVSGDRVLVAVGRRPYTQGLGAAEAGVTLDARGFIPVDHDYQTNVPGIYAIGDVIPGPMLAHLAEDEGVVCVERMNGIKVHINTDAIPAVAYTWPEVASVGATEEELAKRGVAYKKGIFPFVANGRAKALLATEGQVKILADAVTDRVLGCHIFGPRAGDLIGEVVMAMEMGASSEDIARTCHAHPGLGEVVREAALALDGRALNI